MKQFLLLLNILLIPLFLDAQVVTRVIRDSLFIPWEMVYGPDDHIWFTQKNGYICRMEPLSGDIDTLYHETNTYVQSESGMLGLALDPNFSTQPYVYVAYNYSPSTGVIKERIVRYSYNGSILQSPQTLLDNINGASIHNGCRLTTVGNKLFITTGDASAMTTAQDINTVNGKTLRINLDGTIPSDNPFAGNPVWSWGHRNAQGMVYANGNLYQSEHGPTSDDEINIVEKGRNYGWPTVKGFCNEPAEITFCNDSNVVEPLKAWTPTIAVGDIDYYDHPMFPAFAESIIMTTLKDQKLYQLQLNSSFDSITNTTVIPGISFGRLRAICLSPNGSIYISTSNSNANGSNRIDKIIEIYDSSFVPVAINSAVLNDIQVFPNPTNDEINIHVKRLPTSALHYSIVNITGQQILSGSLQKENNIINMKSYPAGVYQLRVIQGNKAILSEKIIKQ